MDFVIGNGLALQLAHTWSFQVQGFAEVAKEVKAWAHTLARVREGGRTDDEHRAAIHPDIPIDIVFAPPRTGSQQEVFTEAEAAFRRLGVNIAPSDSASSVADRAQSRLREAGLGDDLASS